MINIKGTWSNQRVQSWIRQLYVADKRTNFKKRIVPEISVFQYQNFTNRTLAYTHERFINTVAPGASRILFYATYGGAER